MTSPASTATDNSFWSGWIKSEGQQEQSIKIKPIYIDINDSNLTDGVIFSQIVYWHTPDKDGKSRLRVSRNGHLWLAKTYDDWWKECRIPERTARAALTRIEKRGLIERHVWQFNGTPTVHVRIITDKFEEVVKKYEPSLIRLNQPNGSGKTGQMVPAKSDTSFITENTTETTKESPQTPIDREGSQSEVVTNLEGIDTSSKDTVIYAGESGKQKLAASGAPLPKKPKSSKGRKLSDDELRLYAELFPVVSQGSFGKPQEKLRLQHSKCGSITKEIMREIPGITAESLTAVYKRYFDRFGEQIKKDPTRRMKSAETISDWLQQIEDEKANAPFKPHRIYGDDCPACKGGLGHDGMIFVEGVGAHHCETCWILIPEGKGNG